MKQTKKSFSSQASECKYELSLEETVGFCVIACVLEPWVEIQSSKGSFLMANPVGLNPPLQDANFVCLGKCFRFHNITLPG